MQMWENNLCNQWHMSFHQMTCQKWKFKNKEPITEIAKCRQRIKIKDPFARTILLLSLGFHQREWLSCTSLSFCSLVEFRWRQDGAIRKASGGCLISTMGTVREEGFFFIFFYGKQGAGTKSQNHSACGVRPCFHKLFSSIRVWSSCWCISRFSSLACDSFSVRTSNGEGLVSHKRGKSQFVSSDDQAGYIFLSN